jgi:hypothetical protein
VKLAAQWLVAFVKWTKAGMVTKTLAKDVNLSDIYIWQLLCFVKGQFCLS